MKAFVRVVAFCAAAVGCHDVESLAPCPSGKTAFNGTCIDIASCRDLPSTCGEEESCCATRSVQGGIFKRGYDVGPPVQGAADVPNAQRLDGAASVKIGDFHLDRFEVTVGRFRRFVSAYNGFRNNRPANGEGRSPNVFPRAVATPDGGQGASGLWQRRWSDEDEWVAKTSDEMVRRIKADCGKINGGTAEGTWTDSPGANENKPMTCINWFEAFMFCVFDGGRLPTEAEWNYAAAGGEEQRAFPWSAPATDTNVTAAQAAFSGFGSAGPLDVGSKPAGASRFGQLDMAGNAFEWTLDSASDIKAFAAPSNDPIDFTGYLPPPQKSKRVLRGGSVAFPAAYGRTSARVDAFADERYNDVGVRCARPLGE